MSVVSDVATEKLVERLLNVLEKSTGGDIRVPLADAHRSLRELGVTSVAILNFLVAAEDELSFEWHPDQPRETFASIASIARALCDSYDVTA